MIKNLMANINLRKDGERGKKISLDRVYIGDIYQVMRIINREFINQQNKGLFASNCHTTLEGKLIKRGALLLNSEEFLKDMEHPIKLKHNNYPEIGDFIVIENDLVILSPSLDSKTEKLRAFQSIIPVDETAMTKKKILEKYHEYKKEIG